MRVSTPPPATIRGPAGPAPAASPPPGPPATPLGPTWTNAAAPAPIALAGPARAAHVRKSILEFEKDILAANPAAAKDKLSKLAESPFRFFRGTADLFYRDLAGLDLDQPRVLALGDVHPENLGALRGEDGVTFYGFDDYDEAHPAPPGWDLRRGATGFELAARERGLDPAERAEVVKAFLDGYFEALGKADPKKPRFTEGEGPKTIQKAVKDTADAKRKDHLHSLTEDDRFVARPDLLRRPELEDRVGKALRGYERGLGERAPKERGFFEVKDVAERTGAGTGSVGLRRFWVLVEGKSGKGNDDVVLELKAHRPSVLARHVPERPHEQRVDGRRLQRVIDDQWIKGDRYAGWVTLDGERYRVRERAPGHDRVDWRTLDAQQLARYARAAGEVLADLHATPIPGGPRKPGPALAKSFGESYSAEVATWAAEQAGRVIQDQAGFASAWAAGSVLPG